MNIYGKNNWVVIESDKAGLYNHFLSVLEVKGYSIMEVEGDSDLYQALIQGEEKLLAIKEAFDNIPEKIIARYSKK